MPDLKITLPDSLFQEITVRAEKRETSVEEYIIKSLRWHLKQVKKIEAGMAENDEAFSLLARAVVSTELDQEGGPTTD